MVSCRDVSNNADLCAQACDDENVWASTLTCTYTGTSSCPTLSPTGAPTTASPTVTCGAGAPVDPDPSVDTEGRNGIMRAAMSGDQTDMTTALADAAQFVRLPPPRPPA